LRLRSEMGGILVEGAGSEWRGARRVPRIVIGAGAVVSGALRFDREVDLYVHATARVGPITGANAIKFSGAERSPDMKVER
jgi:hypothetical protein